MNQKLYSILALTFFMMTSYKCFHSTGHMVVARITEIELEKTRIYSQMREILDILSPFTKENVHPFVESGPWADDIKYTHVNAMDDWHFHDNYVNLTRPLTKSEIKKAGLVIEPENIVWASNEAKGVLRNTHSSLIDDRLNKSVYLRMLIHFYGDLHQPLHNVSLVNEEFPKGDQGGNLFKIKYGKFKDLHSFWDTCVGNYDDISAPLTKKNFEYIDSIAKKVMKKYSRKSKEIKERLKIISVKEISEEGIQFAIDKVYKGIKSGETPSDDYIQENREFLDQQLAIAGYRLTDLFKKLFADENVLKKHVREEKEENNEVKMIKHIQRSKSSLL